MIGALLLATAAALLRCVNGIELGPPKLLVQPPEEVWYQLESGAPDTRPTLHCQASENAEEFVWRKNGDELEVGGDIEWQRPGQSGSIVFVTPKREHQGYYQCFVRNIFGVALSNKVHLRLGVLDHFPSRARRVIEVREGDPLTIDCQPPAGTPQPTIFWLYRDTEQDSVIETIRRRHITVDGRGRLQFSAVEKHDARDNLIYECAATSPVLHGEYRAGDHIQLRVKPRTGAAHSPIKLLYATEEEVTVRAGGRLKLQCIFAARPLPVVFWSKLDGDLPKQRMKDLTSSDSDFGKSLVIEKVHPEDAGHYECRAQHMSHVVNVRVLAAPYWDFDPPQDVSMPEDATCELECLASGSPPPIVQWALNGVPLHELPPDPRRLLLDGGRVLRIGELDHDRDTGVYQCNASNPLGYVYANAFVNVRAHAPRFLMPDKRIWKVVLRSTIDMDCGVEAAPEPVVRWVDADDRPLHVMQGKTQLFSNHTFRIRDVSSQDEGLYYCNVSNKYGINRAMNKLQVFKPTYFVKVPSPKRLSVESGEHVELQCEAVADPRLSVIYKWTINGRLINETTYFHFSGHSLHLRSIRGRHSGIIDCAAVTDVDVKVASMQLIVNDVPAWAEINSTTCNERKATLRWPAADPHGDRITRYSIEMSTDFNKDRWERVFEETNTDKEWFEADITLTPWVNYTFRVISENSHGRADKRGVEEDERERGVTHCHTRPSFPYTNPQAVRAEGNQPDNLIIFWQPLDKYYWNAPHLQYLIRYKLAEPHIAWSEFIVEDSMANHTIIREQPTFRKYLVQVRAVNAMGPSILEPEVVEGWSGEDVPVAPPNTFSVENLLNFTARNFSWEEVDPSIARGHFHGYEITYWRTDHPGRMTKVKVPPGNAHFVVNGLKPNTNYTAVIRTKNKHHTSYPSSEVRWEMPEGVPSKVEGLNVIAVGAVSMLVEWQPPAQPNGVIRGYFLTFENDWNVTEETYVLHRQTHYLHERAHPDTAYKVSVWAETSAGEGRKSLRPMKTWPLKNPDLPDFRVHNVTTRSAEIEWIPNFGKIWRMPGSAFLVNYTREGSRVFEQSKVIYLPSNRLVLEGLEPATRYLLQGVARDGLRSSHAAPLAITTHSLQHMSHLNQESLRNAAWFVAVLCAVAVALIAILASCCCERTKTGRYAVRRKEIAAGTINEEEERQFLEFQYGYKA